MATLTVRLLGKFDIARGGQAVSGLGARKVQELLCYLLVYRDRRHSRESLASSLWAESSTAQAKKYLRQALWQLQAALDRQAITAVAHLLLVEPEWIFLNPAADLWLDIAVFEQTFMQVQGIPGRDLDTARCQTLRTTLDLYRGDFLEDYYQDWCLYEREHFQSMYLAMLDKLMDACEINGNYEIGLSCGARALYYDPARERTHRRLMRLHYLAGDRTRALRQYELCVQALRRELAVEPSARTIMLYEQIRTERFTPSSQLPASDKSTPASRTTSSHLLDSLKQIQAQLTHIQIQIQQAIQSEEPPPTTDTDSNA